MRPSFLPSFTGLCRNASNEACTCTLHLTFCVLFSPALQCRALSVESVDLVDNPQLDGMLPKNVKLPRACINPPHYMISS